jgi:hypothetical protein
VSSFGSHTRNLRKQAAKTQLRVSGVKGDGGFLPVHSKTDRPGLAISNLDQGQPGGIRTYLCARPTDSAAPDPTRGSFAYLRSVVRLPAKCESQFAKLEKETS